MPIKKSDITHLQSVAFVQLPKNRDEMRQVIELFKSRKIETLREAQKTIEFLGSKGKIRNILGLERLEKHKEKESAVGELQRYNESKKPLQTYHISGSVTLETTFKNTSKNKHIGRIQQSI